MSGAETVIIPSKPSTRGLTQYNTCRSFLGSADVTAGLGWVRLARGKKNKVKEKKNKGPGGQERGISCAGDD